MTENKKSWRKIKQAMMNVDRGGRDDVKSCWSEVSHAHLTKKLRLVAFVEMNCFLRNRSLEFPEIWHENSSLKA